MNTKNNNIINPQNFIQEFRNLFINSPHCGSWARGSENCEYGDIITVSKDCYMCFNSGNCRNAYYCEDSRVLIDCIDCNFCEKCELCYECIDCDICYNSSFCQDCSNCNDIYFSYDLRRCKNCIGCVNLRNKQYCIYNEQKTKEEYENFLQNLNQIDFEKIEKLKQKTPRMYVHQFDTENCTGDYIYHSKNCHMCFDTRHTEDSGYIIQANLDMGTKDSWDCGPIPTGMDLCYDIAYSHFLFNCNHLYWCGNLKDCEYCTNCFESENLFGCQYVKNKQNGFYILNKKVDENYYKKTKTEIKKILKENNIYTIYDLLYKDLSKKTFISPENETKRTCSICNNKFELCNKEIEFYKKKEIPFPAYCFLCRQKQRSNLRNKKEVFKRKCDKCKKNIITTYPNNSNLIIYCLDCYLKNIN